RLIMRNLIQQLAALREHMIEIEKRHCETAGEPHPNHMQSQSNLLHYLALRSHDLRPLQRKLAELGLSSLGRMESHVLASTDAVLTALHSLGQFPGPSKPESAHSTFETGNRLLGVHTRDLLGPDPPARSVRIMVTLPSEAEHDYTLIHSLIQ